MNWYVLFYVFSILEKISNASMTIAILSTILFVALTILYFYHKDRSVSAYGAEDRSQSIHHLKTIKYPRIIVTTLALLFWLVVILLPSRKDMLIIIAGGAVGEFIINDPNAKKLPGDITKFLRGEILKATAGLTDEARESIGIQTESEKIKKLSKDELEKLVLDNLDKITPDKAAK